MDMLTKKSINTIEGSPLSFGDPKQIKWLNDKVKAKAKEERRKANEKENGMKVKPEIICVYHCRFLLNCPVCTHVTPISLQDINSQAFKNQTFDCEKCKSRYYYNRKKVVPMIYDGQPKIKDTIIFPE